MQKVGGNLLQKKKELHMIFINIEKSYDRTPREVLWLMLQKKIIYGALRDRMQ